LTAGIRETHVPKIAPWATNAKLTAKRAPLGGVGDRAFVDRVHGVSAS
jgi:hypothetical protein